MSAGRLLATNAPSIRKTVHLEDGKTIFAESHDVSKILEANHFQQSKANTNLHHDSETLNHYARIDNLAIKKWCEDRGIKPQRNEDGFLESYWEIFFRDEALTKAFLNDPDNKVWRTRLGKI